MSMEKSSEEVLIAVQKKDENESSLNASSTPVKGKSHVSDCEDGEIIDDDTSVSPITIPLKKLQKNFRARHSEHSSDEEEEGLIHENKPGMHILQTKTASKTLNINSRERISVPYAYVISCSYT